MKKIIAVLIIGSTLLSQSAFASTRKLVCTKSDDMVTFSLCGVRGCTATVELNGGIPTDYPVTRTKGTDGSLLYRATSAAQARCRFKISPLHSGTRTMINAPRCAPSLASATCAFQDN